MKEDKASCVCQNANQVTPGTISSVSPRLRSAMATMPKRGRQSPATSTMLFVNNRARSSSDGCARRRMRGSQKALG